MKSLELQARTKFVFGIFTSLTTSRVDVRFLLSQERRRRTSDEIQQCRAVYRRVANHEANS